MYKFNILTKTEATENHLTNDLKNIESFSINKFDPNNLRESKFHPLLQKIDPYKLNNLKEGDKIEFTETKTTTIEIKYGR
jgi:hypothetical protein